jgi:ABC-type uncharacterized transport system substrate-binding protein
VRRRDFITVIAGAATSWPLAARAQQPEKMLRIGTANVQPRSAPQWVAFERRMSELGYVEGKNFNYDHVQISGTDAWEAGYRQVVERNPDIIVAAGPELSLKSALTAADKLPIVMIAVDYDPIGRGYVTSLARPTGNVTGIYFQNVELAGKHLQLMKQAFPDVTTAIVFWDRLSADYWAALQAAAPPLAVRLIEIEFRERPYDYESAIAGVASNDLKFLFAVASPFFFLDRAALAEFALRHRLASFQTASSAVEAGSLMSYGANLSDMWVRAASYVDKIAKGISPADLPIEQPTKFELIINAKTARALGVTIPPGVLAIADEVIE